MVDIDSLSDFIVPRKIFNLDLKYESAKVESLTIPYFHLRNLALREKNQDIILTASLLQLTPFHNW